MEYHPKYPQLFSLSQAIALNPAVAWDEIARLKNSMLHLKRSQDELQEYLRRLAPEEGDREVSQALRALRASQDERIFMLKLALTHHGHSVSSIPGQTSNALASESWTGHSQTTASYVSNGLDDFPPNVDEHASILDLETAVAEGPENGVHL